MTIVDFEGRIKIMNVQAQIVKSKKSGISVDVSEKPKISETDALPNATQI